METARHVRDVNQRHKARVIAHPIEPKGFTHITIDCSHVPSEGQLEKVGRTSVSCKLKAPCPTEHLIKQSLPPSHRSRNFPRNI
jgi:hypothetical protein